MEGTRHSVTGADGVEIGLLTAGSGPELLLVHGGMGTIEAWRFVWPALTAHRRVTAMDRRGRGSSGDGEKYSLEREYGDVAAVATDLARAQGGPVDVVGHSIGATCVLGAAVAGAPLRRIALYEPPGPATVAGGWPERVAELVAEGKVGPAIVEFLTVHIGLTHAEIEELRNAQGGQDVRPIFAATMPREARGLAEADLPAAARQVHQAVLLLLGTVSPPWAGQITRELAAALPAATVVDLPGQAHEALRLAPDLFVSELERFFSD